MPTKTCPKCDRVFSKPTEHKLNLAFGKHIWWHDHPDWTRPPVKNKKTEDIIEKRKNYQRKWREERREKLYLLEQANSTSASKNGKFSVTKEVSDAVKEVFDTLTCCPGCGKNLYKIYLGLKVAEQGD